MLWIVSLLYSCLSLWHHLRRVPVRLITSSIVYRKGASNLCIESSYKQLLLQPLPISIDPRQTRDIMGFINNIAPKPTAPATAFNLLQRAEASDQIVLSVAPNNVCGYISGRLGASRACPAEDRCYFHPPPSSSNGGVFCCGKTTCQYHATCINSRDYFQSSKCVGGCEVDNYTLKWSNHTLTIF